MNVWFDWVTPMAMLLMLVLTWIGVLVTMRLRRQAEHARSDAMGTLAQARRLAATGLAELQRCAATTVHHPGPLQHLSETLADPSPDCAKNRHRWVRRDIANIRRLPVADGKPRRLLCSVTWHCGDCPATRHEQNVPAPLSLAVMQDGATPSVAARSALPDLDPAVPLVKTPALPEPADVTS